MNYFYHFKPLAKGHGIMQRIKISDGIHFNMLPQEKFKTNFFQVAFVLNLERENTTPLSLLSGLLFRASEKYPDIAAINNRLDYLYDTSACVHIYKKGERLIFCYESEFLKDEYVPKGSENLLIEAVDMFRQLVFKPRIIDGGFDGELLKLEKIQLEKDIKSIINNKNAYAKKKCTELMCEGEKYSIDTEGETEDIPLVTEKGLYEFYLNMLKSAHIEVFFNGDGDAHAISEEFAKVFRLIENRKPVTLCNTLVKEKARDEVVESTEEMPVNQGKLVLGFRTGIEINHKLSAALTLLNEVFGGSPVSKLFMNVREKMSLCYYCRSVPDSYKGVMFVMSGIESENRDKSLKAILHELDEIKAGNISEDELSAAKLSILNSYKALDDNPSLLSTWYLSRIICGNFEQPLEVAEKIKETTATDIVAAANKICLDTVYFLKGTAEAEAAEE